MNSNLDEFKAVFTALCKDIDKQNKIFQKEIDDMKEIDTYYLKACLSKVHLAVANFKVELELY